MRGEPQNQNLPSCQPSYLLNMDRQKISEWANPNSRRMIAISFKPSRKLYHLVQPILHLSLIKPLKIHKIQKIINKLNRDHDYPEYQINTQHLSKRVNKKKCKLTNTTLCKWDFCASQRILTIHPYMGTAFPKQNVPVLTILATKKNKPKGGGKIEKKETRMARAHA